MSRIGLQGICDGGLERGGEECGTSCGYGELQNNK